MLGAVSALYDKYLLKLYEPTEVQAWYSLYQCVLMALVVVILRSKGLARDKFKWKWTILGISLFLTAADLCYFIRCRSPAP